MSDLTARSVECLPPDALAEKLRAGRPLRVKLGVDPTAPDIHLGHAVVLGKLREFQDAGHTAVLVIGDWTARVGDPSGRSATRPMLSEDDIEKNAATYQDQAFRILDRDRTEVRRNGEWFADMGLAPLFELAKKVTVNQLLRRKDFGDRMGRDEPISVLELLYPLMQAYDSVALEADVELGGTDQLFNLMLGREVQEKYGQPAQCALTMPILPGTDGEKRMSKSTGNYVGVSESPEEQFGKVMSIPDGAMAEWYRLLFPAEAGPTGHPNAEKRRLARLVADRFHGDGAGAAGEARFDRIHKQKAVPDDVPEIVIPPGEVHLPALLSEKLGVGSRSDARRLVGGGAVKIGGEPVTELDLDASALDGRVLQAGKRRFARIRLDG